MSQLGKITRSLEDAIIELEDFPFIYRHGVVTSKGGREGCILALFDASSEFRAKYKIRRLNSTFNKYTGTTAAMEMDKETGTWYVTYSIQWPFDAKAGYIYNPIPLF